MRLPPVLSALADRRRRWLTAGSLAIAAASLAVLSSDASPAPLEVGFTYTHTQVHCDASTPLRRENRLAAGTRADENLIANYAAPGVRQKVRSTLADMRRQGAGLVRTILWFRHDKGQGARSPNDALGMIAAHDGQAPDQTIANLSAYVRDVRDAGFDRLVLVLGPQGTANPRCRQQDWGDCYDSSLLANSWALDAEIIRTATAAAGTGLKVTFDIAPEACPDPTGPQGLDVNFEAYTRYMVGRYRDTFHDSRFIVSCGGKPAQRAAQRLDALTDLYRSLRVKPDAIDFHIYDADPASVEADLLKANAVARSQGVPFFILETYYDHPNLFEAVSRLRRAGRLDSLAVVSVFPTLQGARCHFAVQAPFSLTSMRSRLGGD